MIYWLSSIIYLYVMCVCMYNFVILHKVVNTRNKTQRHPIILLNYLHKQCSPTSFRKCFLNTFILLYSTRSSKECLILLETDWFVRRKMGFYTMSLICNAMLGSTAFIDLIFEVLDLQNILQKLMLLCDVQGPYAKKESLKQINKITQQTQLLRFNWIQPGVF